MEKEPYSKSRTMHLLSYQRNRGRAVLYYEIKINGHLEQSLSKYVCFCM